MRRSACQALTLLVASYAGSAAAQDTQRVYDGLRPFCEGCHSSGVRAYFVSLDAFEALVVRDPRLVLPGLPDESELVRLLEGNGTGAFPSMPPGERSYADLVEVGEATLTVVAVREWIAGLDAQRPGGGGLPDLDAPRVTLMAGTRIQRTLYQQLGLGYDDFFETGGYFAVVPTAASKNQSDDRYPFQAPEAFPAPPPMLEAAAVERFFGLNGGSPLLQVRASLHVGPTFLLTLTQVAQAWCGIGLEKTPNEALFPDGGDATSQEAATVKSTLRRWHLHFWGVIPDDDQVDQLYDDVYVPLAVRDAFTGYVGVCSYFIRHPNWIFY